MKRILLFIIVIAGLVQFACKKNSAGTPVVKDVRVVTPAQADSFFTQALPGTMIVIQGSGFTGLQAVYFNDTATNFNPVYATNTNIICTIPSTAQTAATNPKVPNVIRIVTNHGTVTYPFTLYLNGPTISSIALDNTGTVLYINGTNLIGIQKVTFPIGNSDTATSWTVNTTNTQITAGIPTGVGHSDSVRVYCTFGEASFAYPPPVVIDSVSNENAVAGTVINIFGTNFAGISAVTFPGGIAGTNLKQVSVSQLTVTVPAGITEGDSLRVTGGAGTVASPFVFDNWLSPSLGFLANFDGNGSNYPAPSATQYPYYGWDQGEQWDGTYEVAPNQPFPNATGNYVAMDPQSAYPSGAGVTWWENNLGLMTDSLRVWDANPATDPIGNYALKFEAYINNWTAGSIWITTSDPNNNWAYMAAWAPWKTATGNTYSTNGWVTVTIPLTSFLSCTYNVYTPTGTPPATIQQLRSYGEGEIMFMYANDGTTSIAGGTFNLGIDNVRIVPIK